MYYILRHGTDTIFEKEFRTRLPAAIALREYMDYYQEKLENGKIKRFTCLLLTKGVRDEKTESIKY